MPEKKIITANAIFPMMTSRAANRLIYLCRSRSHDEPKQNHAKTTLSHNLFGLCQKAMRLIT